jgi:hypothetical protein
MIAAQESLLSAIALSALLLFISSLFGFLVYFQLSSRKVKFSNEIELETIS